MDTELMDVVLIAESAEPSFRLPKQRLGRL